MAKLNIMDERLNQIEKKIDGLWEIDEFDSEINQKYYDVEYEFMDIVEEAYSIGYYDPLSYTNNKFSRKLKEIKKKLKEFKEERDIYEEDTELDMMFPDGMN